MGGLYSGKCSCLPGRKDCFLQGCASGLLNPEFELILNWEGGAGLSKPAQTPPSILSLCKKPEGQAWKIFSVLPNLPPGFPECPITECT